MTGSGTETFVIPYDERQSQIAWPVVTLLIALLVAWIGYDKSDLECRREAPGATPLCVGHTGVLFRRPIVFRYAAADSMRVTVRVKPNGRNRRTIVETPDGDLSGGVEARNAKGIVAAGNRFLEDPDALVWSVHQSFDVTQGCLGIAGVCILVLLVWRRSKRIVLDHDARTVFANPRHAVPLDMVESVELESIYRARTRGTLTLVTKSGKRVELLSGCLRALRPVEAAIKSTTT